MMWRRPKPPTLSDRLHEMTQALLGLLQEQKKMNAALTNLQAETADLQSKSTAILALIGSQQPPADSVPAADVQAEADKVHAVNAQFAAVLNPPAPAPEPAQ